MEIFKSELTWSDHDGWYDLRSWKDIVLTVKGKTNTYIVVPHKVQLRDLYPNFAEGFERVFIHWGNFLEISTGFTFVCFFDLFESNIERLSCISLFSCFSGITFPSYSRGKMSWDPKNPGKEFLGRSCGFLVSCDWFLNDAHCPRQIWMSSVFHTWMLVRKKTSR